MWPCGKHVSLARRRSAIGLLGTKGRGRFESAELSAHSRYHSEPAWYRQFSKPFHKLFGTRSSKGDVAGVWNGILLGSWNEDGAGELSGSTRDVVIESE